MFQNFIHQLELRLNEPLPGKEAQFLMASDIRLTDFVFRTVSEDALKSGVLILLYPFNNSTGLVLMQRAIDNSVHSGQVSLPGGKYEKQDANLCDTALRETFEEIGVKPEHIKLIGELTELYIPPSNFIIYPFVGYCTEKPQFIPDEKEVGKIIEADISEFLNPVNRKTKQIKINDHFTVNAPVFDIQGNTVWGATAMILSEFFEVVKEVMKK